MKIKNKKNQTKKKSQAKKKSSNNIVIKSIKKINSKTLALITFFAAVVFMVASYAWLSASLNVRINFFDMTVASDSGLFISLDGVAFSESVQVSLESIINQARSTYPRNTNQWSAGGLWPVSSNGIKTTAEEKFNIFIGEIIKRKSSTNPNEIIKYLNTKQADENESSASNVYIAFDFFLKNISGSPLSDNLYFDQDTLIGIDEEESEDIKNSMSGIMNSMRIGIVKMGSVNSKETVSNIQNIGCNNNCQMVIYEPNSLRHSDASITSATEYGLTLTDGVYTPTYGIVNEGIKLNHFSGQAGTGIELDSENFGLQNTIKEIYDPIFSIPNGITKFRAYVWIEGQDVDSLETNSKGAAIYIIINFVKDLAGYEE